MSSIYTAYTNKNHLWQTSMLGVSTIAEQIIEDVEQLYGRAIDRNPAQSIGTGVAALEAKTEIPSKGQLVVVASRSQKLSEEFRLRIAHLVGLKLNQSVLVFSANDNLLRFTRKLIDGMASIPPECGIYDGHLNGEEFRKLSDVLSRLCNARLLMNKARTIRLDDLCASAKEQQQGEGKIGLIIIDSAQQIVDNKFGIVDSQQCLIRLKSLAEELMVPIVALLNLDPAIENHSATLTYNEMRSVERLAELADGFEILSGYPENFVIKPVKMPNAKSVEWLANIPRHSLIDLEEVRDVQI